MESFFKCRPIFFTSQRQSPFVLVCSLPHTILYNDIHFFEPFRPFSRKSPLFRNVFQFTHPHASRLYSPALLQFATPFCPTEWCHRPCLPKPRARRPASLYSLRCDARDAAGTQHPLGAAMVHGEHISRRPARNVARPGPSTGRQQGPGTMRLLGRRAAAPAARHSAATARVATARPSILEAAGSAAPPAAIRIKRVHPRRIVSLVSNPNRRPWAFLPHCCLSAAGPRPETAGPRPKSRPAACPRRATAGPRQAAAGPRGRHRPACEVDSPIPLKDGRHAPVRGHHGLTVA